MIIYVVYTIYYKNMFGKLENSTRHIFSFEDVYDFAINVTYNDSQDFFQVMGFGETCYPYYGYLQALHTFYIPVIIVFGFVGNILSFLVLLTTHLKLRSSSYYLAALAVSDFGFLFVVFIVYCSFNDIFELYHREGFCQFFHYLSSVCAFLSVWFTVAFTVERFIAVRYPLRRQYICTVSRAKSIVFGITVVACVLQLHLFWVAGMISHEDKLFCEMKPYYWLLANIINCLDTFMTLIIPVILIVVMNVMIARIIFKSPKFGDREDGKFFERVVLKPHVSSQSQSSSSTKNSEQEYSTCSKRCITTEEHQLRRNKSAKPTNMQVQQNINKMLLVISSVFIILNFPSYIFRITAFYGFTIMEKNLPDYLSCIQQFTMILYYTNFSVNFLLYAMCGKSFRLCLKKFIKDIFRSVVSKYRMNIQCSKVVY